PDLVLRHRHVLDHRRAVDDVEIAVVERKPSAFRDMYRGEAESPSAFGDRAFVDVGDMHMLRADRRAGQDRRDVSAVLRAEIEDSRILSDLEMLEEDASALRARPRAHAVDDGSDHSSNASPGEFGLSAESGPMLTR